MASVETGETLVVFFFFVGHYTNCRGQWLHVVALVVSVVSTVCCGGWPGIARAGVFSGWVVRCLHLGVPCRQCDLSKHSAC